MARRRNSSCMDVDGMLLLDKLQGCSSNHALQTCRRLLNARKAGHTGSLDPLATGLLPLCFGQATKISGMFLNSDKSYDVKIRLGINTDSGDREGAVISQNTVSVDRAEIDKCLDQFRGEIEQTPPMYSAIKRNGQPLYKLARQGVEVEREPRQVTVFDLSVRDYSEDLLDLHIRCSKGFYVRSLAIDIGKEIGCGAHVEALRRTSVGHFTIDQCVTIDQLEALSGEKDRQNLLIPPDQALLDLPEINLPENMAQYFCQGQSVRIVKIPRAGLARLYCGANRFLGLGEVTAEGKVSPKRIFV